VLSSAGQIELQAVREVLEGRFGLAMGTLEKYRLMATPRVIWAVREDARLEEALAAFSAERTGLPLLRRVGEHWKPTSVALQVLGPALTRSVVALSDQETRRILTDGSVRVTLEELDQGYVAMAGSWGVIGCGLYLEPVPEEGKPEGLLRSLLPKAKWEALARHLREEA
jgi:hypothetical protein